LPLSPQFTEFAFGTAGESGVEVWEADRKIGYVANLGMAFGTFLGTSLCLRNSALI
jgi:hypothetical protein